MQFSQPARDQVLQFQILEDILEKVWNSELCILNIKIKKEKGIR